MTRSHAVTAVKSALGNVRKMSEKTLEEMEKEIVDAFENPFAAYNLPIYKIIEDNCVRDIQEEEDRRFFQAAITI